MSDGILRFRIKKGNDEIELEGEFKYVSEKFEDLLNDFPSSLNIESEPTMVNQQSKSGLPPQLINIVETTAEGRPILTIPFDMITSKEAIAIFLYANKTKMLSDKELSNLLTLGWKTTRPEAVRARASELRREGKLIAENGTYTLSGAEIQCVELNIIEKIKGRLSL